MQGFDHPASVENDDTFRGSYGGEPMRDDERRAPGHQPIAGLMDYGRFRRQLTTSPLSRLNVELRLTHGPGLSNLSSNHAT